jgi:hypothetical protein
MPHQLSEFLVDKGLRVDRKVPAGGSQHPLGAPLVEHCITQALALAAEQLQIMQEMGRMLFKPLPAYNLIFPGCPGVTEQTLDICNATSPET